MKKYIVVIPARFLSSRLPGKPLISILGKTMIQRVYERCLQVIPNDLIYIATDDQRIQEAAEKFGANVVMTSKDCKTGTDRVAEVSQKIIADYYINVQGDEPVFNPDDILDTIAAIDKFNGEVINGYCKIKVHDDFINLSIPKVVFRPDGRLMYMSRKPIPGNKNDMFNFGFRQVCIYAFPRTLLRSFKNSKFKTPLENEEDIEILRFLELGFDVRMIELSDDSISVDHIEDIIKVIKKIEK
uniref:3-deoxy-manno-octulosonate cytidylyltransferase n=1 Tax=Flavobacterium sp. TaxID=239 RepID=UPI0040490486